MYTQYQQYNQHKQQPQQQQSFSTEQGMFWNGSSWLSRQSGLDVSSAGANLPLNGQSTNPPAPYQQQLQQVPSNPVHTYTQYYHNWKAHGEQLQQHLHSLHHSSSYAGNHERELERKNLENRIQWAKYYADESSRAAHHFHQNPQATSAPFELPPAPPNNVAPATPTTSTNTTNNNNNNQNSTLSCSQGNALAKAREEVTPGSLTRYVKRCVEQYQHDDEKKKLVQEEIEMVIAQAIQSGTLQTRNWDVAPLVHLPSSTSMGSTICNSMDRVGEPPSNGVAGLHTQQSQQLQEYRTPPEKDPYVESAQPQRQSNHHGNFYLSTVSSSKEQQQYGHYGRYTNVVNGVGTRQMEQASTSSPFSGGGNYYGPTSDSIRHHDPSASSSSPFSSNPNIYHSPQSTNKNKRIYRSMVSSEQEHKQWDENENFLALPRVHKGEKKKAGRISNNRKKIKAFQGNTTSMDGMGLDASYHALTQRANRFSGPGGTTDVAMCNHATVGNDHDKYMGKRLIGGNKMTLDEYDYEQMTVKGTCTTLEKEYLRLTAPPRSELVRPLAILQQHLKNLQSEYYDDEDNNNNNNERGAFNSSIYGGEDRKNGKFMRNPKQRRHDYLWYCSQLKAVRQDCTVQRIQGDFAVNVYETHARIALEEGDLNEYNQCQTQLKELYKANVPPREDENEKTATDCIHPDVDNTTAKSFENQDEFVAYRLLYYVFLGTNEKYNGGSSDMFQIMLSLSPSQKTHPAILHALHVREAVAFNDYLWFFRLHKTSPNLGRFLTGLMVPTIRMRALRRIVKAFRPSLELNVCLRFLGFESIAESDDEGKNLLISCGCVIEGSSVMTKDSEVLEPSERKSCSLI